MLYQEIQIQIAFFEFLKFVLINMVAILMMPSKLATLGPLKIKVFQNKGYDAIIFSMRDQRNFIM